LDLPFLCSKPEIICTKTQNYKKIRIIPVTTSVGGHAFFSFYRRVSFRFINSCQFDIWFAPFLFIRWWSNGDLNHVLWTIFSSV